MSTIESAARHVEMDSENYRELARFPGYRFGRDGSVWSCKEKVSSWPDGRRGFKFVLSNNWKRLKQTAGDAGYMRVSLGGGRLRLVHRLILEAFVGECPAGHEAAHDNGNPSDNRIGNLQWKTHSDNCKDKNNHGTGLRGEGNIKARLTVEQVLEIRRRCANGEQQKNVRVDFGIDQPHISAIVRRIIWQHV